LTGKTKRAGKTALALTRGSLQNPRSCPLHHIKIAKERSFFPKGHGHVLRARCWHAFDFRELLVLYHQIQEKYHPVSHRLQKNNGMFHF
jgi:hypothetical protein